MELFRSNFPQYANIDTVVIGVSSNTKHLIRSEFLEQVLAIHTEKSTKNFIVLLFTLILYLVSQVTKSVERSLVNSGWDECVTEVMSYSKYKKESQQFAGIFMSSDYFMSTIFILVNKTKFENAPLEITKFFSKEVLSYDTKKGKYSFLVTSFQSLTDATKQSSLNVTCTHRTIHFHPF